MVNILCIVRDPRDVYVSSFFYASSRGMIGNTDFHTFLMNQIENDGFCTKLMSSYLKHKDSIGATVIRYEDVIKNTIPAIAGAIDGFGYKYNAKALESAVEKRSFVNMSSGRGHGDEDSSSHYRKGVIGDWKNYFSDNENHLFIDRYEHIMKGFGYL